MPRSEAKKSSEGNVRVEHGRPAVCEPRRGEDGIIAIRPQTSSTFRVSIEMILIIYLCYASTVQLYAKTHDVVQTFVARFGGCRMGYGHTPLVVLF